MRNAITVYIVFIDLLIAWSIDWLIFIDWLIDCVVLRLDQTI